MSRAYPKWTALRRELQRQGWRIARTNNGHFKAYSPDGFGVVTFSSSSDYRAIRNTMADLKRLGFRW